MQRDHILEPMPWGCDRTIFSALQNLLSSLEQPCLIQNVSQNSHLPKLKLSCAKNGLKPLVSNHCVEEKGMLGEEFRD